MSPFRRLSLAFLVAAVLSALLVSGLQAANWLSKRVHRLVAITDVAADLAGFEGPRRYLLAFQNLAEARGTGGLLGAYAVIELRDGELRVERKGSDTDLHSQDKIPISMPAEYLSLYGQDPAIWQNSNLSPHFPNAAKIWLALWQRQTKQTLDGVIAVDPVLIKSVLGVTGPVRMPSGEVIDARNVVRKTLSDAYIRFDGRNDERKSYLVELMNQVLQKLKNSPKAQLLKVMSAIAAPAASGRLSIYSTHPRIQKALARSQLGGTLSNIPNNEYRAIVINADGSKLDYYTRVQVNIRPSVCAEGAETEIVVKVSNAFDGKSKLPDYVWGRLDKARPKGLGGAHALKLMIFGPSYAEVLSLRRERYELGGGYVATERHRPVAVFGLDLKPRSSETIRIAFSGGIGKLIFKAQPLVEKPVVRLEDCKK